MKIKLSRFRGILTLTLFCTLVFSACGGGPQEPEVVDQELSSHTVDLETEDPDAVPSGADDYYYIGTNLEGVDVCELIPMEEIISVVGTLREDETEVDLSMAGEVGCKYVDQDGQWFYVTYYPLGEWDFVEYTLNESEMIEGVLDGAWRGVYSSDEIHIKALAADEMVIGAFVSDGLEETALSLVELLYEYRPK